MTTKHTRDSVIELVKTARDAGKTPNLCGIDLNGLNLSGLDLGGVNFVGTNLSSANLQYASLTGSEINYSNLDGAKFGYASLVGTDLSGASCVSASFVGTNFEGAYFRGTNLYGANFGSAKRSRTDFAYADLTCANFINTYFRGATGEILAFTTPSGEGRMVPTPAGWRISIGGWTYHTLNDLKTLITDPDAEWPEAYGKERKRRLPALKAAHKLAKAHAKYHKNTIPTLAEKWGTP